MDRRTFLGTLTGGLVAAPLAAGGEGPPDWILIGSSASFIAPYIETFRQAPRGLGYREGQSIAIEYRYAEGNYERLPVLAAELVWLKVDIIVTEAHRRAMRPSKRPRQYPSL